MCPAMARRALRGALRPLRPMRRGTSSTTPFWPTELDASISDGSLLSGSLGSLGSVEHTALLPGRGISLSGDLAHFAGRKPTPLSLSEILAMKTPEKLQNVLQEELPVRLANRIAHFDMLPDLADVSEILSVRSDFSLEFEEVRQAKAQDFEEVIKRFRKRNEDHANRLTTGFKTWGDLQRAKGQPYEDTRAFIDSFLNRLFLSRIGMETLTSQYLALSRCPDGIVDVRCDLCQVCAKAAKQVTELASDFFLSVPKVEISFHGNDASRTLPLIPHYLFYIVAELLKNSFRAVAEQHQAQGGEGKPEPLQIRIACDDQQVALVVMDRGGGIPFERQPHVWSYMYTTARGNKICKETGRILDEGTDGPTPFSGYGVGLPLSRLYAEYLGGSLHLMSMPNFGTHAYLFLQHCSDRKEALPNYVNWLRKRKLREDIQTFESSEKMAAASRDYAEALRFKALLAEAQVELSKLEAQN